MLDVVYTCAFIFSASNVFISKNATTTDPFTSTQAQRYPGECFTMLANDSYVTVFRLRRSMGGETYKLDVLVNVPHYSYSSTGNMLINQPTMVIPSNKITNRGLDMHFTIKCTVTFPSIGLLDRPEETVRDKFLSYCKEDPKLLMKFDCGNDTVSAVTRVMMSLSPVIDGMMNALNVEARTRTIKIDDFDVSTVEKMVEFCETNDVKDTIGQEMELYKIADKYNIDLLRKFASALAINSLNETNVVELYQFSKNFNNTDLEQQCIALANRDKLKVMKFAQLDRVEGSILKKFWIKLNNSTLRI